MIKAKNIELLKDEQAVTEINRHRWIESEKAGCDIGFDKAAADWLNTYSDGWLAFRNPVKAKKEPARSAKKVSKK